MFGCGLRCVEVSRLDVDDFDPFTHTLHITGKAGHQRNVPVPEVVRMTITGYLANGRGHGPLVRRDDNRPGRLGAGRISGLAGRMIRDAGIKSRLYDGRSAHGLRAAAASDLFDACGDATVVQEFLGHANLQTTSIYLRRAKTERVAAAQTSRRLTAA